MIGHDGDLYEVSSDEECKTHFPMWSTLKSPLLISTDIKKLDSKAYSIYSNSAIIAVNQDPLGAAQIEFGGPVWTTLMTTAGGERSRCGQIR
jgi:alpha-galactosidase